jgi:hypothetical protein
MAEHRSIWVSSTLDRNTNSISTTQFQDHQKRAAKTLAPPKVRVLYNFRTRCNFVWAKFSSKRKFVKKKLHTPPCCYWERKIKRDTWSRKKRNWLMIEKKKWRQARSNEMKEIVYPWNYYRGAHGAAPLQSAPLRSRRLPNWRRWLQFPALPCRLRPQGAQTGLQRSVRSCPFYKMSACVSCRYQAGIKSVLGG